MAAPSRTFDARTFQPAPVGTGHFRACERGHERILMFVRVLGYERASDGTLFPVYAEWDCPLCLALARIELLEA